MGLITQEYLGKLTDQTYSFMVPFSVAALSAIGIGQGGVGGSASGVGGRGGGAAGGTLARINDIPVTPGEVLTIFVPGLNSIGNGIAATIKRGTTVLLQAQGGQAGENATTGHLLGAKGVGSIAGSIGDILYKGGDGFAGASGRSGSGGGAAGTDGPGNDATSTGAGGFKNNYGGNGGPGITGTTGFQVGAAGGFMGGGGGGAKSDSSTLRVGGPGGYGAVVLYFNQTDSPPTPSDAAYCDDFTGGDNPDINGRQMDGCGGTPGGNYDFADNYNFAGDSMAIVGGKLVVAPGVFNEVIYPVPNAQCPGPVAPRAGRLKVRWPNRDSISVPETCTLLWEDDFSGASGPLDGRVHNGGSLGSMTYRRIDSHSTSSPTGAQLDGAGAVYLPEANKIAGYHLEGGGALPANYDVIIDVERTSASGGNRGDVGATVRGQDVYPPVGSTHGRKNFGLTYATETHDFPNDKHGAWTGWVNDGSANFGTVITGSTVDPPGDQGIDVGETKSLRYKVRGTSLQVWTYFGPTGISPCDTSQWRAAAGVEDCEFGWPCLGVTGTRIGVRWNALASSSAPSTEHSYRIKRIRIYQYSPAVSGLLYIYGYPYVIINADDDLDHGYLISLEGEHASSSSFTLSTSLYEYGGVDDPDDSRYFMLLRNSRFILNGIPVEMDTDYILEGGIEEDPVTHHRCLCARVNGVLVRKFDLDADIPDGSDHPLNPERIHTGGAAGIGGFDGNIGPDGVNAFEISRFEILCAGEPEVPCEGPPDNPYPHNPPPYVPPPSAIIGWKNGAFRIFTEGWQFTRGAFRKILGPDIATPQQFWGRGQMRPLTVIDSDQLPPPDTDFPPFYDPCGLLPEFPPDVPVDPISGRFFGMHATPLSVMGPLLTGTKIAVGNWLLDDLAVATTKGCTIIGGQGGYSHYKLNGFYNRDYFIDQAIARLTPLLSILQDYTASGEFFGYNSMDDFESKVLWPPSGIPDGDVAFIMAAIRAACPGIRVGLRGRPRQFPFDPQADFYSAQYVSWRGETASQFATAEYSLAMARGSLITLDLNYVHGGNGSSGLRFANGSGLGQSAHNFMCSPSETASYLSDMFTVAGALDGGHLLAGTVGYEYEPTFLAQPGMSSALAAARNVMAALPPP